MGMLGVGATRHVELRSKGMLLCWGLMLTLCMSWERGLVLAGAIDTSSGSARDNRRRARYLVKALELLVPSARRAGGHFRGEIAHIEPRRGAKPLQAS